MKSNIIFVLFVIISIAIVAWVFLPKNPLSTTLASPESIKKTTEPVATPLPTPKSFDFSKDTDLKSELETINPTTNKADFADLEAILK